MIKAILVTDRLIEAQQFLENSKITKEQAKHIRIVQCIRDIRGVSNVPYWVNSKPSFVRELCDHLNFNGNVYVTLKEFLTVVTIGYSANFSADLKQRNYLWRFWQEDEPKLMFIGLNPSKAGEDVNDPTISKLMKITRYNGYGGFAMTNLFTYISTDPKELEVTRSAIAEDMKILADTAKLCDRIVFAWGSFKQARLRAPEVMSMFPKAYCLQQNGDGYPKHPLYCFDRNEIFEFDNSKIKPLLT